MINARRIQIAGKPLGAGPLPAIITPLVGRTMNAVLEEVAAIRPKNPDMLEWRIDFFDAIADTAHVIATALALRAAAGGVPVLLTRRHANEGGQPLALAEPAVVAMLAEVCKARCVELIDYELSNAEPDLALLRRVSAEHAVAMIMSYHNFQATPPADVLQATFARAQKLGADVGKVAVMPKDPADVLTLLGATYKASQALSIPLISMAMGSLGSTSRMMGWMYGSAATFAVGRSSSAPGQLGIDELRAVLATLARSVLGG